MISTTLFGGLGNQMFIYATVRAMALRNNVSMSFNLKTGFERDFLYHRNLELDKFSLPLPKGKREVFAFPLGYIFEKVSMKVGTHLLAPRYKIVKEDFNDYHFQRELKEEPQKNVYLIGYWQTSQYFNDYADVIRKDFTIAVDLPKQVKEELEYLQGMQRPLVMVGIRRYQEAVGKNCRLKICNANYYNKAMGMMCEKLDNPLFVIFGEQKEWGEANLDAKYDKYFVEKKTGCLNAISDLYLMMHCHHAIISNSTYYWWGAWLQVASQDDHMVIAPDNFINPESPCKEWTILKTERDA